MGKKKKSSKKAERLASNLNLITAILNIVLALILLLEKIKS